MAALTPRHFDRLEGSTAHLLPLLAARGWAAEFYLAGSAALALYLGHREVRDLDLMSPTYRLRSAARRDLLEDLLDLDAAIRVETARDGFLYLRTGDGVGIRFYYYPYPLADPEESCAGLPTASPVDLGLMKLGAAISRGTRRDFVDLYFLCRELPLAALLARAPEKYGHVRDFTLQALKGLADRSQVGGEPMPRLTTPVAWSDVEAWLEGELRTTGRRQVGLAGR